MLEQVFSGVWSPGVLGALRDCRATCCFSKQAFRHRGVRRGPSSGTVRDTVSLRGPAKNANYSKCDRERAHKPGTLPFKTMCLSYCATKYLWREDASGKAPLPMLFLTVPWGSCNPFEDIQPPTSPLVKAPSE